MEVGLAKRDSLLVTSPMGYDWEGEGKRRGKRERDGKKWRKGNESQEEEEKRTLLEVDILKSKL